MKKLLIPALLISNIFATTINLIDFGKCGTSYPLLEENGDDLIQRGLKDLNVTQIENNLKQQVNDSFFSKETFLESNSDSIFDEKDYVTAQFDIISPDGYLLYQQGEKIPAVLPDGASIEMCFINGNDDDEVIKWVIASFGKCIYMVNNADVRLFDKKYKVDAFPIGGQNMMYVERYGIQSLPTKIIRSKGDIKTITLDIVKFKEELQRRKYGYQ